MSHEQLLRLVEVPSFTAVRLLLLRNDGSTRPIHVAVGGGPTWDSAVRFPTPEFEGGESTGDPELDQRIRWRAAEELARLEGAVRALEVRRAA